MDMLLKREFSNPEVRKIEEGAYSFTASDETVDRYRTVIKADSWVLDNYRRNPIALYNHNSGSDDPSNVIGKFDVEVKDHKLTSVLKFAPASVNPKAEMVKGLVDFGALSAVSVGFNPIDWSMGVKEKGEDPKILYFRKVELLEISVVDIPANPNTIKNAYSDFIELALSELEPEPITPQEKTQPDPFRTRLLKLRVNTL